MGVDCKPVEEIEVECADSAAYVKERRTFLLMLGLGVAGVAGALFAAATHLAPPPNARPTPPRVAVTQPAAQPRPAVPPPTQPVVVYNSPVKAPQPAPVVVYGQKTSVTQSNGVVITTSSNASSVRITAQPRARVRTQVVVAPPATVQAQPPRAAAEAQADDSDF